MLRGALYGMAELPSGGGLGNRLVPWALCHLWCRERGVPMLAPSWGQVRWGRVLRRGHDPRAYPGQFTRGPYVAGLRRLAVLAAARRVDRADFDPGRISGSRPVAVRFAVPTNPALRAALGELRAEHHAELAPALLRITRPALRPSAPAEPFLAVHVRLDDFLPRPEAYLRGGWVDVRQPMPWYVEALRALRAAAGPLPAVVFSDGEDDELAPLLAEPRVSRALRRPALADLWALAGAAALVTSRSTFSMWASFLGQLPSLWYPGRRHVLHPLVAAPEPLLYEPQWEIGDALHPALVREVARRTEFPGSP